MNVMTTNSRSFRLGFAIQGMLLNITVGSLVLLGAGSFGLANARKLAKMASFPALNGQDQNATRLIAQDLRGANLIESANSDGIVLRSCSAGQTTSVTYSYNRALRTLTRQDRGTSQVILTGLDDFSFSLFQRPASNAGYCTFVPATAAKANVVGCHWSCSRQLAGAKLDSEDVEIAPTMLRNHH